MNKRKCLGMCFSLSLIVACTTPKTVDFYHPKMADAEQSVALKKDLVNCENEAIKSVPTVEEFLTGIGQQEKLAGSVVLMKAMQEGSIREPREEKYARAVKYYSDACMIQKGWVKNK